MIKIIKYLYMVIAFISLVSFSPDIYSQDSEKKKVTYKKARALQSSTAKEMAKVFKAYERLDENGKEDPDLETVKEILTKLRNNIDNLKSYDKSVVWYQWGYIYTSEENYNKAIDAYTKVINEPEVTKGLREGGLLILAQLHLSEENFDKSVELLLQWMSEVDEVTAQSWSILAAAYYQTENFEKSMEAIETAINLAEEEGYKPKENWYLTLSSCIQELKTKIGKPEYVLRLQNVYEILIDLYPKKDYFMALAGTYNELGREKDVMITLKAAYSKDLLNKESEYTNLAQLLLLNENPYWAAQVLINGQKKLIEEKDKETEETKMVPVVKENEKNLKLLADAWRMAQELDKAIPVLEKVSKIAKDGKTYVLLGNLYLSIDKIDLAISSIEKGLKKGGLDNKDKVYLALGQAHFENQSFEAAKKQFRIAARSKDKKVKQSANNWLKYTENEEIRVKNLALRRDFIQNS